MENKTRVFSKCVLVRLRGERNKKISSPRLCKTTLASDTGFGERERRKVRGKEGDRIRKI